MSVSFNPDYRPSDPPQVGSQRFNSGNGASQPQNGYGQPDAYGSSAQPGSYGYGQPGSCEYGQSDPYGYSQPMTYGAPMIVVRPKPNALSAWSMWMGIIGLGGGFICGLFSAIPFIGYVFAFVAMFLWIAPVLAVIFGHVAHSQIKKTGEDGRGQATTGLILGYIGIGLALLLVIIFIGVMGLGLFAASMNY